MNSKIGTEPKEAPHGNSQDSKADRSSSKGLFKPTEFPIFDQLLNTCLNDLKESENRMFSELIGETPSETSHTKSADTSTQTEPSKPPTSQSSTETALKAPGTSPSETFGTSNSIAVFHLKQLIDHFGGDQSKVSAKLGQSISSISPWIKGERPIPWFIRSDIENIANKYCDSNTRVS